MPAQSNLMAGSKHHLYTLVPLTALAGRRSQAQRPSTISLHMPQATRCANYQCQALLAVNILLNLNCLRRVRLSLW